ncbi:MAG: DUF1015 family protein [Bacillota bacterium]
MPRVLPFAGLHYNPERAGEVASLLADAADWGPHTIRHPSGKGQGAEPATAAYQRRAVATATRSDQHHASRLFSDWAGTVAGDWLRHQVLAQDDSPSLYLYRCRRPVPEELRHGPGVVEEGSYVGILAGLGFDKDHPLRVTEQLDPSAVEQMVPAMKAFALDVAPVWAVFSKAALEDRAKQLDSLVSQAVGGQPVLKFGDPQGGSHELWRLAADQAQQAAGILSGVPMAAVQGGLQVAAERELVTRRGAPPNGMPPSVLALVTSVDGPGAEVPAVLPVHRLLLASSGISAGRLEQRLASFFRVMEVPQTAAPGDPVAALEAALAELGKARPEFSGFVLYTGRGRFRLVRSKGRMFMESWTHPLGRAAWRAMDINVLHALVFERILGMPPQESRTNAPPVATELSPVKALDRVDSGEAVAAFFLAPPAPAQLLAAALENNATPADAVRPWPPVPAGLVLRWRRRSA